MDADAEDLPKDKKVSLQAEYDASEAAKAHLVAEMRKVRKEASKAESNLRNEIEAVKRGIDRMTATDHRSKQKVLALQELIKQTTVHVKEINEQAQAVEEERQEWEDKEAAIVAELEQLRQEFEAEEREINAQLVADDEAIAAVEKLLKAAEADVKSKEEELSVIRDDKLPSIRAELEKVRAQIKENAAKPAHSRRGGHGSHRGGRHASGPSQMVPSQALPRQKGGHGLGHPSSAGRGGKFAQNHNARASSGPAAQAAFQGPFKPFVPGANGTRAYRPGQSAFPPQASTNPFDPTSTEMPFAPGFGSMGHADALYGLPQFGGGPHGYEYGQDGGAASSSSPTGSERRSSLPQLFGKPSSSVLNPKKPEFIPAAASANASPVLAKGALQQQNGRPGGLAPAAVSSPPAGIASVEHSPTASSRFAFPLARHNAGPISKPTPANGVPSPIGSDRQPAALHPASLASTTSQLFPPGFPSGSRASPLLSGSSAPGTSASPLMFSNSPRFGPSAMAEEGGGSTDAGFGKFGPLDYDPRMDDFGPAPTLSNHTIFGGSAPFATSLFGSDTWATPGAPTTSSLGSGGSHNGTWVAPSPPLGVGQLGGGDIWSAPGVRTKLSLGDMTRGYGGRTSLVQDLRRNGSRFMNVSAPVSPTSPTIPGTGNGTPPPLREEPVEEKEEPPSSTDGEAE